MNCLARHKSMMLNQKQLEITTTTLSGSRDAGIRATLTASIVPKRERRGLNVPDA
jgi:hypothetical protein